MPVAVKEYFFTGGMAQIKVFFVNGGGIV